MSVSTFTLTLPAAPEGEPPSALPILPSGGALFGKDGRSWTVDAMEVLRRLAGRLVVLDENHSTYLRAPRGEEAPAMARLSQFAIREDGSLWAENVEWTKIGREKYENGEYLGISPIVVFDPAPNLDNTEFLGTVVDIHSVALVNDPNLPMPALNASEMAENSSKSENNPAAPPVPAPDLGATIGAAIAQALAPFAARLDELAKKLEAAPAPAPAPAATPEPAPTPAVAPNASGVPAELIESAFERYCKAGVITPAGKAGFLSACSASLEAFTGLCRYYDGAPQVVGLNAAGIDPPPAGSGVDEPPCQGADAAKICKMFGRSVDDKALRD